MLLKHLEKIQQEHDIQQEETGMEPEVIQPTIIKVFSWYYIVNYTLLYTFNICQYTVIDMCKLIQIQCSKYRSLSKYIFYFYNYNIFRSLCIFDSERHPNMHQKREKESLSLFGISSNQNML